jgi:hypothetical protein
MLYPPGVSSLPDAMRIVTLLAGTCQPHWSQRRLKRRVPPVLWSQVIIDFGILGRNMVNGRT